MKKIFLSFMLCAVAVVASAKLELSSLIGDNMVLQQQSEARLWGWCEPNATVKITTSWSKATTTAMADADGCWLATVATPEASFTEQAITIACGKDVRTLTGILIGEVWLASGQSNMEMPLKGFAGCCVEGGIEAAMNAQQESPFVRMFTVPKRQSYTLQDNCEGSWKKPTFANALDFSAIAYFFASTLAKALNVPIGIVNSSYGGAHVESWQSLHQCEKYDDIPTDSAAVYALNDWDRPMLMYNAMFWPVRNYTVKGIIWYQGCSNIGHADVYAQRLADMVSDWRQKIGLGNIPFYEVELAPYIFGANENSLEGALLREAQMEATKLIPNSGIVSTNDLAYPHEVHNIHPSQKRKVGQRLAWMALNRDYGMNEVCASGPRFKRESFRIDGNKAIVGFTTNQFGICRNYDLTGFEIAGDDRTFHPATVEFHWQTNEVYLTSPDVPTPIAVRYCFKDFQIGNLIGGYELPLFPFRTDNW